MFHPNDKVEIVDGVALVNGAPGDYAALLDHLTYSNYRANRHEHGLSAELAAKYYDNAAALEYRYQAELARGRYLAYLGARAAAWDAAGRPHWDLWREAYDLEHGGPPQ